MGSLTLFGVFGLSAMMGLYALEDRKPALRARIRRRMHACFDLRLSAGRLMFGVVEAI